MRFYKIRIQDIQEMDKTTKSSRTKRFIKRLVKCFDLKNVKYIIITEFDGFLFFPSGIQKQIFKDRVPHLFLYPHQSRITNFDEEITWADLNKTLAQVLIKQNPTDYINTIKDRFPQIGSIFEQKYLSAYLTRIFNEEFSPIWCRLPHPPRSSNNTTM